MFHSLSISSRNSLFPRLKKILSSAFLSLLVSVSLLTGVLAIGCGGGSSAPPISVSLSPSSTQSVQQGGTVSIVAAVTNDLSNKGVTWSLSGTGCTAAGCGSLTNQTATSATYNAPASVPSNLAVTVIAQFVSDT